MQQQIFHRDRTLRQRDNVQLTRKRRTMSKTCTHHEIEQPNENNRWRYGRRERQSSLQRLALVATTAAVLLVPISTAFVTPSMSRGSVSATSSTTKSESWSQLFLSERLSVPGSDATPPDDILDDNAAVAPTSSSTTSPSCFTGLDTPIGGQASLRLGPAQPTVWTEFSRIGQESDIRANLGQGFPDWRPPTFAVESLVEAALDESASTAHQYTRPAGHPPLVRQLARRYSMHMRHEIDPMTEVAVTVGASQALYLTLQTLIQPGDEVILFEPFFDLYVNQVKLAGGTPVFVPLEFVPYDADKESHGEIQSGEWILNADRLNEKVTSKTKAILLNSPHNPTGKLFSRNEMEHVAASLELAHPDCVVLSDEVYKYIVHSPPHDRSPEESLFCRGHVHFASLPGMWDRTVTISSAGKTFSATGWQIGWCVGPRRLVSKIHQLLPYVQFCASTVIQEALARSLKRADEPYEGHPSYYDYLRALYTTKRDRLAEALQHAGFGVPDYDRTPGGGFFIFARIGASVAALVPPTSVDVPNPAAPGGVARADWALCEFLAQEHGILCIPSGPFFSVDSVEKGVSDTFVRIAFCKTDDTIDTASELLLALNPVGAKEKSISSADSSLATMEAAHEM